MYFCFILSLTIWFSIFDPCMGLTDAPTEGVITVALTEGATPGAPTEDVTAAALPEGTSSERMGIFDLFDKLFQDGDSHADALSYSFTDAPTEQPTESPTTAPTDVPTLTPTAIPTAAPTASPTSSQTMLPTAAPVVIENPAKMTFTIELVDVTSIDDIDLEDEGEGSIKAGLAEIFSVDVSQILLTIEEVERRRLRIMRVLVSSVLITVEIRDVDASVVDTMEEAKDDSYDDGSLLALFTNSGVNVTTITTSDITVVELCTGKPGYYCMNETHQSLCGAGYYCPSSGLAEPLECQPGYYCPTMNQTEQLDCDIGTYCPMNKTIQPTACSLGSICNQNGLSSEPDCPRGYYCPDVLTQTVCSSGNYCPARSSSPTGCEGLLFQTCPFQNMSSPISCATDQENGPKCYDSGQSLFSCDSSYTESTGVLEYLCFCEDGWEGQYCDSIASEEASEDLLYVKIFVPITVIFCLGACLCLFFRQSEDFKSSFRTSKFSFHTSKLSLQLRSKKSAESESGADLENITVAVPLGAEVQVVKDEVPFDARQPDMFLRSKRLPASRAAPKTHSSEIRIAGGVDATKTAISKNSGAPPRTRASIVRAPPKTLITSIPDASLRATEKQFNQFNSSDIQSDLQYSVANTQSKQHQSSVGFQDKKELEDFDDVPQNQMMDVPLPTRRSHPSQAPAKSFKDGL